MRVNPRSLANPISPIWDNVEGSFMAAGSTIGGAISQRWGVHWTFLGGTLFLCAGLLLIVTQRATLRAADHVPSPQSDLRALEEIDGQERQ